MIKITLCFPIPTHTSQPGFVQAEPAFVGAATSNWQRSATTHEGMRTSLSCSSSNPHLFASTHGCMSMLPDGCKSRCIYHWNCCSRGSSLQSNSCPGWIHWILKCFQSFKMVQQLPGLSHTLSLNYLPFYRNLQQSQPIHLNTWN